MGKETKVGLAVITLLLVTFSVLLVKRLTGNGDLPAAEILAEADDRVAGFQLPQAAKLTPAEASEPPRLAPNEDVPPTNYEWMQDEDSDDAVNEPSGRRLSFMPKVETTEPPAAELLVVEAEPLESASPAVGPQGALLESASATSDPIADRYGPPRELEQPLDIAGEAFPRIVPSEALVAEPERAGYIPTNYQQAAANTDAQADLAPRRASEPRYYDAAATAQDNPRTPAPAMDYQTRPPAIERNDAWQSADRVAQHSTYEDAPRRPAAQPVGTGATRDNNRQEYIVRPNDNMWKISEQVYSSGAYFKALIQHNARWLENPQQLRIGDRVRTPSVAELAEKYPDLCPKVRRAAGEGNRIATVGVSRQGPTREYHVRDSDTLFDIARFELGQASRWVEIYELNQDVLTEDFNYLPPGTVLRLPMRVAPAAEEQPDSLTRQPDGTIRQ
ncbi:MAG: LysM peptidoglycan-binding domain-containing protein [Pirellulales bacterium]